MFSGQRGAGVPRAFWTQSPGIQMYAADHQAGNPVCEHSSHIICNTDPHKGAGESYQTVYLNAVNQGFRNEGPQLGANLLSEQHPSYTLANQILHVTFACCVTPPQSAGSKPGPGWPAVETSLLYVWVACLTEPMEGLCPYPKWAKN